MADLCQLDDKTKEQDQEARLGLGRGLLFACVYAVRRPAY